MKSQACSRCGAATAGRSKRVLCTPCRADNRRTISKRYRERQKRRPDYVRPFLREQLGLLHDDPQRLENLAAYLRKYEAVMERGQ